MQFIGGGLALDRIDLADAARRSPTSNAASGNGRKRIRTGRGCSAGLEPRAFRRGCPPGRCSTQSSRSAGAARELRRPHGVGEHQGAALAGITKETPDPTNGVIVKDPRTGEPTGVLKEAAIEPRWQARAGARPRRTRRGRCARPSPKRSETASPAFRTPAARVDDLDIFAEARAQWRSRRACLCGHLDRRRCASDVDLDRLDQLSAKYPDDPLFKAGAVNIMLDRRRDRRIAHGAALLEPYANEAGVGAPTMDPGRLQRIVRLLDAGGWQVMTHAIGDRAVADSAHGLRTRRAIEPLARRAADVTGSSDVETVDAADLPRFGALGVIASMQPAHGIPARRKSTSGPKPRRGSRVARLALPRIAPSRGRWRLAATGRRAALNPMLGLHTAVNRTTPDGLPEGGWYPRGRPAPQCRDRRLHVRRCVGLVRRAAQGHASAGHARRPRRARPTTSSQALGETGVDARVELTIFDGKIVYRRARRSLTDAPVTP